MSSQFDWYKLSLLDAQKPDLQKFQSIIRTGNISKNLQRVPTSYRKNLLVIFQNLSYKMKSQTKAMSNVNDSLIFKKNSTLNRLQQMQSSLQESKLELVRMKSVVTQKKKMVKKLEQKIQTIKKNKTQQTYFCPFCARNHQTYKGGENELSQKFSMPNNSLSLSAHNQLKDFIMTLKDKEMEMMKMILNQKKELETQELEKLYEKQMNLMTMKNKSEPQYLSGNKYSMSQQPSHNNYGQDIDLGANNQEIHGESQFLFYQKSQKYKQAVQKEEYSLKKALQSRKKELNSHPYYDFFKNMEENKSLNVDAQHLEQQNFRRGTVPEDSLEALEQHQTFQTDTATGFKILSKFNLKSNGDLALQQKPPVQPLKMTSNTLRHQEFNPSITDRLKEEERKNSQSNSIYSGFGKNQFNKKSSFSEHQHVFCSGLLVDDNGGHSDYEDYFDAAPKQKTQNHKHSARIQENESINFNLSKETHVLQKLVNTEESLIQDEEIKLNPGSYSFVSKSSFSKNHISELLSPNKDEVASFQLLDPKNSKDKYKMYNNSHDKSSQIVDLSDSFSRRDFELSKDESSINLSDLKLSKLEKKRLQEKEKVKNQPKSSSPTYTKMSKEQEELNEGNFTKKPLEFMLVSEEKPLNIVSSQQNEQKINLLSEFEKKVDTPKPLIAEGYSFQKKQTYELNEFYKQPPSHALSNQYRTSEDSHRSSKLNEFMRIEYSRNENRSPNVEEENERERVLSPQEYFAQEMKKNQAQQSSHYQGPSSSNYNQFSYVSHTSSSQPQRVDPSEYERPLSRNKREYSSNKNQQNLQDSGQRSSARNRKRLQRHEDLEDRSVEGQKSEDVLNQFFKNEFQGQSKDSSSGSRNQNSYNSSASVSGQRKSVSRNNSESESHSYEEGSALDEFIK